MLVPKQNKSLKGKDLITIGIFSAIYFVLSFLCNILGGLHPLVWIFSPAIAGLVSGIPFLIMTTKVKKPFAVLVMGSIVGLVYFASGQFPFTLPLAFIAGSMVAEMIRAVSRYTSFWMDALGFAFFSLGMAGSPLPIWLYRDSFFAQIMEMGMPSEYITNLKDFTSARMLIIMLIMTLGFALIGSFFTKILFKKHFKKAGIV